MNKETGELVYLDLLSLINLTSKRNKRRLESTKFLTNHLKDVIIQKPEGSSGNMKLPKECCVYCRHKFECHSDANDGLGFKSI